MNAARAVLRVLRAAVTVVVVVAWCVIVFVFGGELAGLWREARHAR